MKIRNRLSAPATIGKAWLLAVAVASIGILTWSPLLGLNLRVSPGVPWSVPAEATILYLAWGWLGGKGRPRRWADARSRLLRARAVSGSVWGWSLLAGACSLAALAGLWIVLVRLTGAGGNPTLAGVATYPIVTVAAALVMGSLVSPLNEEAAFRGYAQVVLERRFSAPVAVALSSIFFSLQHGPTQGFAPSKIFFYFVVGLVFGALAFLTKSTLPALPVHFAGDLLFFTMIWPHDADRLLVWAHGFDAGFWINAAQMVVFGITAVWAFRRLRATTQQGGESLSELPDATTASPKFGRTLGDRRRQRRDIREVTEEHEGGADRVQKDTGGHRRLREDTASPRFGTVRPVDSPDPNVSHDDSQGVH